MSRADLGADAIGKRPLGGLSISRHLFIPLILFIWVVVEADEVHFISSKSLRSVDFDDWINKTQENSGMFLNHSSYTNGEVILFRTKKSRYRAIPIMDNADEKSTKSKYTFETSLTFKEWLRRVYSEEKAVRVSIRSTEVVRPVILHLHASRERFKAPIIIHADTFDSESSRERAVDLVTFIEAAKKLLPESIISLGWTPSADYSTLNKLDWSQTFRLMEYVYDLQQPLILSMRLNDAIHSSDQLEWLLGVERPHIYLVVKGEVTDFVDKWQPLSKLTALASGHKLLFDVDDSWRTRIGNINTIKKGKRSIAPEEWQNFVFQNPYSMLSTSIVSTNGVAFLGWPNSLLISNKRTVQLPTNQRVTGKILFLAKRQVREISPAKRSGVVINLFETDPYRLSSPSMPKAIRVYIGYDGFITIENSNKLSSKKEHKKKRSSSSVKSENALSRYHESAAGQMPQSSCYGFDLYDKGWRVELEVWSEECSGDQEQSNFVQLPQQQYRTFLQLETPLTNSRKTRNIAIGKVGDGAIDFLVQDLRHSGISSSAKLFPFPVLISLLVFVLPYLFS
ncbi:Protein of unknown function DUF2181 family-containing protein [Aphelenchoides bicaudatus]|nr:Protein of unknown function DUF2181 family-containing protein [Aphelenchoides bicaudatus]